MGKGTWRLLKIGIEYFENLIMNLYISVVAFKTDFFEWQK